MQGLFSMINVAKSMIAKSLAEPIPQNFDNCIFGFRCIVEFLGKDDEVILETAEILNSEWELIPEISEQFMQYVAQMVEDRNIEYKLIIEQEKEIQNDQQYWSMVL
ncbi:hypothetical protein [Dysgonomonas sp. 25]|uniref:hypothetical protein n=1 Tax=Dysgonomonas sp. 25 TaxID=2302933 RepID=UPI0013D109BB|nr:hypothetical protein [Dysgonomonas sp. 25]NDV68556.1 hypothetical protein [Dysgonomonas sp. 25]